MSHTTHSLVQHELTIRSKLFTMPPRASRSSIKFPGMPILHNRSPRVVLPRATLLYKDGTPCSPAHSTAFEAQLSAFHQGFTLTPNYDPGDWSALLHSIGYTIEENREGYDSIDTKDIDACVEESYNQWKWSDLIVNADDTNAAVAYTWVAFDAIQIEYKVEIRKELKHYMLNVMDFD